MADDLITAVGVMAKTGFGSVHTTLAVSPVNLGDAMLFAAVVDGTVGSTNNSTNSTTITYPSRTPSGPNRAYIGLGYAGGTGSTSGATAGYTVQLDQNNNPLIRNPSVSTVQTPTSVQTSAKSNTIATLIKADNPRLGQFLPFFM